MILANHGVISSSGGLPPSTLLNNLYAVYKAESNANDSLSTYNGTAYGGLTYASGKSGNAFSFNGTTSYVELGDVMDVGLSSWTYSCWFKASDVTNYPTLFNKTIAASSQGRITTYFIANKLAFLFQADSSLNAQVFSATTINLNTWYNAVFIIDRADKLKLYINGVLEAGTSENNNISSYSNNNYNTSLPFMIGAANVGGANPPGNFFNGLIDEFAVWNRVLTQAEITELQTKYYPFLL